MAVRHNDKFGYCVNENSVLTFQFGGDSMADLEGRLFGRTPASLRTGHLVKVSGYNVLTRGVNDTEITDIRENIKSNRLLPEVIEKQVRIMYGLGLYVYRIEFDSDGKLVQRWVDCPPITEWLRSWNDCGITDDANDFALECIRRYYYFEDFFVKWRFFKGRAIGGLPVAGLELVENSRARLASEKELSPFGSYTYDDFTHVMVGDWRYRGDFSIYPLLRPQHIHRYDVAISHHANGDVDGIYGRNKAYDGSREWLLGANENPRFIRSFLRNSMAAKVHVIIPNEWVAAKRKQIQDLCEYNRKLKRENKEPVRYNGVEIGTDFHEGLLTQYTNIELERLTTYLSGADNQGKMFASFSFLGSKGEEVKWKIEQIDLKYKEYIESLISFDRRADEVLLSAKGIDPSISNVSKEGVISKSGSDAYYNYLLYLLQLPAPEKICCDAINMAVRANFPHLWRQGYMVGFYRPVPARQQEVSPDDRITSNQ